MPFLDLVDGVGVIVSTTIVRTAAPTTTTDGRAYEVTGMSPQSSTLAQLSNGFASRGTL